MLGFVGHCSLTNKVYKNFLCDTTIRLSSTYSVFTCVLSILKCGLVNKVWVWNGNSCISYVPPVCVGDTKDSSLWGGIWPPHQYYQGRRWLWGEYNCAGILIQTFFMSVMCAQGFEHVQLLNNQKNFTLCSVAESHWMLNPDIQQSVQALHHFVNVYMQPVTQLSWCLFERLMHFLKDHSVPGSFVFVISTTNLTFFNVSLKRTAWSSSTTFYATIPLIRFAVSI
jgi:hypothetical protein